MNQFVERGQQREGWVEGSSLRRDDKATTSCCLLPGSLPLRNAMPSPAETGDRWR